MVQGHRVVPSDDVEIVSPIQDRQRQGALQCLCHPADSGESQFVLLLQQLHRHIAVCLDFRGRQFLFPAELLIIIENTIMGQRKGDIRHAGKRMVIEVVLLIPLGGHPRMAHDATCVLRQAKPHQMGRPRALIDGQTAAAVIRDAGSVSASCLAGRGQSGEQPPLL